MSVKRALEPLNMTEQRSFAVAQRTRRFEAGVRLERRHQVQASRLAHIPRAVWSSASEIL